MKCRQFDLIWWHQLHLQTPNIFRLVFERQGLDHRWLRFVLDEWLPHIVTLTQCISLHTFGIHLTFFSQVWVLSLFLSLLQGVLERFFAPHFSLNSYQLCQSFDSFFLPWLIPIPALHQESQAFRSPKSHCSTYVWLLFVEWLHHLKVSTGWYICCLKRNWIEWLRRIQDLCIHIQSNKARSS